jgi:hypothetical protein
MGLFGKKDKKEEVKKIPSAVPELPELPKLPELPPMNEFSYEEEHLPQLPTFPNNSLGNKFSQNTIKEAVSGKKEDDEVFDAEDFPEEKGMMQKPLPRHAIEDSDDYEESITMTTTKPKSKEVSQNYAMRSYMTKKAEPVFIRIDKFEESMKIFQDIKSQISEIEELIKSTKEIKNKEEEELSSWETEIQTIKNQIEKVDQDIFSRIE